VGAGDYQIELQARNRGGERERQLSQNTFNSPTGRTENTSAEGLPLKILRLILGKDRRAGFRRIFQRFSLRKIHILLRRGSEWAS
jgi:hypothetical protein